MNLACYGIHVEDVRRNLPPAVLYQEAIQKEKAYLQYGIVQLRKEKENRNP